MIRIESVNNLCRHWLALQLMKNMRFKKFLEIGIGNGTFLKKCAQKRYCGKGIDSSDEAIRAALDKIKRYNNVTAEKLNFFDMKTERHDLIIMLQVLEHIKDDISAFKKIKELLREGGYFILSVPAHRNRWGYIDLVGGHHRRYEKEGLCDLLDNAGFKILHFYSIGYPIVNLLRVWEEFFYRRYYNKNVLSKKSLELRTQESGVVNVPWVMAYPPIFKAIINEIILFPFLYLQKLFLNTDLGLNYLILATTK